jgi:hypothetical protein
MSETKEFCPSCTQSIFCPTWSEYKCRALERRIYNYASLTECKFYKKRGKDFKEPRCQCEDCLKNESLREEED